MYPDSVAYERTLRLEIEALMDAVSTCPVPARAEALQRIIDEKCKLLEAIRPPLDDPNSQAPTEVVAEAPGANVEQTALMALAAVNGIPVDHPHLVTADELAAVNGVPASVEPQDINTLGTVTSDNGENPCHGSYGTINYI